MWQFCFGHRHRHTCEQRRMQIYIMWRSKKTRCEELPAEGTAWDRLFSVQRDDYVLKVLVCLWRPFWKFKMAAHVGICANVNIVFPCLDSASPVINTSSMVDSSSASTAWASGCRGIASNWMRRRPSSSGWTRPVGWLHIHSIRLWSMEMPYSRHSRSAISAPSSIRPSASSITSPDWYEHDTSIYGSFARFADRWPSIPACFGPCNGLISTWLLQRTPRRSSEVPSRSAVRCHEGRRTPHPCASSEKLHDWCDLHGTALARHSRTSRLQTLRVDFSVSTRVCTSLSCRIFHPGWCNRGTVQSSISGHRPVVCSTHQDCDNRQFFLRLLGTISQWIFVIQISVFLVLERNLKLICLKYPLLFEVLCHLTVTCALLAACETFLMKSIW